MLCGPDFQRQTTLPLSPPTPSGPTLLTYGLGSHQGVVGHSSLALCQESQFHSEKKTLVISRSSPPVAVEGCRVSFCLIFKQGSGCRQGLLSTLL